MYKSVRLRCNFDKGRTMIIYKITNKINGHSYIGLSIKKNIRERYHGNWYRKHHNQYLSNAVNLYGPKNFKVELLESNVQSKEELKRLEKFHIAKHNTFVPNGYNFTTGGDSPEFSEISKRKLSESVSQEHHLVDYKGKEYIIFHLKDFCKERGLSYPSLKVVISKQNISSQGFALKGTPLELIKNPNKEYKLINYKTKEVIYFKNISEFALEKKLNPDYLSAMINGFKTNTPCGDYIKEGMDISKWFKRQELKDMELKGPDGKIYKYGGSSTEFARLHPPLLREDVTFLIRGKAVERKGWRLASITDEDIVCLKNKTKPCGVYVLYDKKNKIEITITNLSQFILEMGDPSIRRIVNGRLKNHKRFDLISVLKSHPRKQYSYISLLNINTNEEISAESPSELWKFMIGLIPKKKLFLLIRDQIKEYNGWTLKKKEFKN